MVTDQPIYDQQVRHGWMHHVLGIISVLAILAFGIVAMSTHVWSYWVFAIVVGVVAMVLAMARWTLPRNDVVEVLTVMIGMVIFISPWTLGSVGLSFSAWACWIIGAILALTAGWLAIDNWIAQDAAEQAEKQRRSHGYRRVSNPV